MIIYRKVIINNVIIFEYYFDDYSIIKYFKIKYDINLHLNLSQIKNFILILKK